MNITEKNIKKKWRRFIPRKTMRMGERKRGRVEG